MRRVTTLALIAGGTLAAAAGALAYRFRARSPRPSVACSRTGWPTSGWGTGPKNLLWIPDGPGNVIPTGRLFAALSTLWLGQFLESGYSVWAVTRKQDMPKGHTMADMARRLRRADRRRVRREGRPGGRREASAA